MWRLWAGGGRAAVSADLAKRLIPLHIQPHPVARTASESFTTIHDVKAATTRAPSRKHRMRILERDEYRCKICGQRPADDVNVELHVHHIRPWADQRPTIDENLLTICKTCHDGLDPHFNRKLSELIVE